MELGKGEVDTSNFRAENVRQKALPNRYVLVTNSVHHAEAGLEHNHITTRRFLYSKDSSYAMGNVGAEHEVVGIPRHPLQGNVGYVG